MIFHLCVTGWKLCCSLNCAKRVQSINKAWSMWLPGPVSFEWVTGIVALAAGVFDASFRVFENIFFNWRLIAIDENKRQGRVNLHSIPSSRRYHVSLAPSRHNKWSESLFLWGLLFSPTLSYAPTRTWKFSKRFCIRIRNSTRPGADSCKTFKTSPLSTTRSLRLILISIPCSTHF